MSDEQARFDREFQIIVLCEVIWPRVRDQVRQMYRALVAAGVINRPRAVEGAPVIHPLHNLGCCADRRGEVTA